MSAILLLLKAVLPKAILLRTSFVQRPSSVTYYLETPVRIIVRGVDSLPANFGVSRTKIKCTVYCQILGHVISGKATSRRISSLSYGSCKKQYDQSRLITSRYDLFTYSLIQHANFYGFSYSLKSLISKCVLLPIFISSTSNYIFLLHRL